MYLLVARYCGSNLSFDVLIDGVALATTSLLRRDQQELRTLRDEWQRVHPSTPLPDDIAALTLEDEGSGRSVIDVILSEEMEEIASPCLPDIATDVAAAWGYQWLALPQIPSLVSWTTDSVNGLRLIAEDIRMCVRRRQVELLELLKGGNQGVSDEWGGEEVLPGKDRICMEFSMLNDMDSEATFDWLVTSLKIGSQTMPSTVRVKLPLSLCDAASTLPAIFMTVEWPLDDRSSPAVSLSSPASDVVANHLGERWHIRILASVLKTGWQIDTLAAVVKGDVEGAINEITNNILKSRTQKSNLAKALVAEIGTMLEWSMLDNGSLSVSIAMVEKKIPFIIIIVITNRYPQEQPEIRISSMKPVLRRAPLVIHTTYPYSPRWDAAELARRVKAWLGEKALGEFIRMHLDGGGVGARDSVDAARLSPPPSHRAFS